MTETRTVAPRGNYALCRKMEASTDDLWEKNLLLAIWQLRLQIRRQRGMYYTPWPVRHFAERSLQMLGNPPYKAK